MNYPLLSDYISSIRDAKDNLDKFKNLRPVLNTDKEPFMSSGNFAVVFKMRDFESGKLYAVKCFLKDQERRKESYQLITDELDFVRSDYLTSIQYLEKELFVDSTSTQETEFPVVVMDWVEGETLDLYIRNHINDTYQLERLCYQFGQLSMWLMSQSFAHGDIKPDNILVDEQGLLKLVDYDGMYVPAMKGQQSRELGSPDYRHPLRTIDFFNEHIDDFSLTSILFSLKAIALNPTLLKNSSSEHLLLSDADYLDLSKSEILKDCAPLMLDKEFIKIYALFLLAHSQISLFNVSIRIFKLSKPIKKEEEVFSTKVTDEEIENGIENERGVVYSRDGKRLLECKNKGLEEYIIKDGTKVIGDSAFQECSSLEQITIPNSVSSIGNSAFQECSLLEQITIPNSVSSIGDLVFLGCSSLEQITIPNSVSSIEVLSFLGCSSLEQITIPNSVSSIGDSAFSGCSSLEQITIPNSVSSIGHGAFYECSSLEQITIPNSVSSIGHGAFYECSSLKQITIPNSVSSIGHGAFYECSSLEQIIIPRNTTSHFKSLLDSDLHEYLIER